MLFREWVDAERVLGALSEREHDLDSPEPAEERVVGITPTQLPTQSRRHRRQAP